MDLTLIRLHVVHLVSGGSAGLERRKYLRCTRTNSGVDVFAIRNLTKEVMMPLANSNPQQYVRVIKTEEKGSDVNLAVHLLNDGFKGDYELAVMVTNDSDLLEPLKIVKHELGLPVGLVNPQRNPSLSSETARKLYKETPHRRSWCKPISAVANRRSRNLS